MGQFIGRLLLVLICASFGPTFLLIFESLDLPIMTGVVPGLFWGLSLGWYGRLLKYGGDYHGAMDQTLGRLVNQTFRHTMLSWSIIGLLTGVLYAWLLQVLDLSFSTTLWLWSLPGLFVGIIIALLDRAVPKFLQRLMAQARKPKTSVDKTLEVIGLIGLAISIITLLAQLLG